MGLIRKEDMNESFWLEGISNPNLLINGDFQVWQRGNIINCKTGVQYTADRWALWCGNNGSIFENKIWYADWTSTGNDNLIQIIEMPCRNIGTNLVFSILMNIPEGKTVRVRVGGIRTGSVTNDSEFIYDEAIFVGTGVFKDYKLTISEEKNNFEYCKVVLKTEITGKISLTRAKLEIGANVTNFVSRPYGEELALCQRYYERSNHVIRGLISSDLTRLNLDIKYNQRKRISPSIKFYGVRNEEGTVCGKIESEINFPSHANTFDVDGFGCIDIIDKKGQSFVTGELFQIFAWEADAEIY